MPQLPRIISVSGQVIVPATRADMAAIVVSQRSKSPKLEIAQYSQTLETQLHQATPPVEAPEPAAPKALQETPAATAELLGCLELRQSQARG